MKAIKFLSMLLIVTLTGCKTQQNPVKQALQDAENRAWFEKAVQALNEQAFVLEADKITFKHGHFTYVTSNTNFISMHDKKATIQMAFNSPYAGPNGIGGITVDGTVSNVQMSTDKKGNISYSMMVTGIGVSASVFINMYEGTNQCTATIYPNFSGNIITFSGNLYPEDESNVFKGRAL
ncbi:DUF4251 domain-containing protein [Dysgonomonas sp. BGC7]|uniref:DUF4251 domain-containing protein n=1 Tax=Dysgonomonas sp. BGC7 TaxID=1658008 RepID=UPI0006809EB3|nr:DUF4251 domain-containing protein [Dysgonomonas sp. BGC7]MBD8389800.1 DUF4251 domain-containing protein [Dysgonomonas sp. BGC7]